ncbi:MAG: Flp family type IVb pilin [Sphingomonadales bacterium]|nr:Flp family type IVb pilin [Sphingomonadales bacterium]
MSAWRVFKVREDIQGATAIEYGLIVALIVIAIVGAISATGSPLEILMTSVENAFQGA